MVGIGMLMIAIALASAWKLYRGTLYETPWLLRGLTWMIPLPFVAVLAGWFVTEVGRQPWIVYGMMTVGEGVTPSLSGWMVLATLVGYVAVYTIIFASGLYYLRKVITAGPAAVDHVHEQLSGTPKRPWSAVDTGLDDAADAARS